MLADDALRLRAGDEVVIITNRKHLEHLRARWTPSPQGAGG
jgi:hypothetical protein